jgi:hypothetical protein
MAPSPRSFATLFFIMAFLASLLSACKRASYESPAYQVLRSDGAFEIRDYPESKLISTPMQQRGRNDSFMRLFRFISGGNERQEKISMTVPVLMSGTSSGTMSFVVPNSVAKQGIPQPSDPNVTVTTMQAARYATYRFKGWINPARSEAAATQLLEWCKMQKLAVSGAPFFASYNPPWTPGFLRRNEVLISLSPATP